MKPVLIPKNICPENIILIQLIDFADASIAAYGCAIYLRVIDQQGKVTMSLLCSKSRIAPKCNKLSVPRLELNAALLPGKLITRVHNLITLENVMLFSDSKVVLAWLSTDPALLNAYVANRVHKIKKDTISYQWFYIKSSDNPADCLSRGIHPTELQCNQLWWFGPPRLINSSDFKFETNIYDLST